MEEHPETVFGAVVTALISRQEQGRLINESSAEAVAYFDQIRKLKQANKDEALWALSLLYQLCGNAPAALDTLDRISDPQLNAGVQKFCVYANLGFADQALLAYRSLGSPESGIFTSLIPGGMAIGAFRTLATFIAQAQRMSLSNMDGVPIGTLQTAAALLERAEIYDEDVAAVLCVAGAILREHGLMYIGNADVEAFESVGAVRLCYRLAITPMEAAYLYTCFLDRIVDCHVPMPAPLIVAFEGTLEQPINHACIDSEPELEVAP
jgi:hypothetical protein